MCNEARGDVSERERVTEQIVTHWFQNKRKLNRKSKNFSGLKKRTYSNKSLWRTNKIISHLRYLR